MRAERVNLVELASIQMRDAFWHQGCDICENEWKSTAAMQVEFGAAQILKTLRHLGQTNRISIRLGFIFKLQSTNKVTNKLTDAVKFAQQSQVTMRMDRGRSMDIANLELCRQQSANTTCFLYEEFMKSGNKWVNERERSVRRM